MYYLVMQDAARLAGDVPLVAWSFPGFAVIQRAWEFWRKDPNVLCPDAMTAMQSF